MGDHDRISWKSSPDTSNPTLVKGLTAEVKPQMQSTPACPHSSKPRAYILSNTFCTRYLVESRVDSLLQVRIARSCHLPRYGMYACVPIRLSPSNAPTTMPSRTRSRSKYSHSRTAGETTLPACACRALNAPSSSRRMWRKIKSLTSHGLPTMVEVRRVG